MADYGKRPMWQWVLIYVVIGGVIYAIIYYFAFAHKGASYGGSTNTQSTPTQQNNPY